MSLLLFLFLLPSSILVEGLSFPKHQCFNVRLRPIVKALSSRNDNCNDDVETIGVGRKRQLTRDFIAIGLPAFFQLTAEPLASLVDTAYLGRLGPEVLGGAGVAISAQYAVSKLYNDPLLRTSISLVASRDGERRGREKKRRSVSGIIGEDGESNGIDDDKVEDVDNDGLSVAVSSALLLAGVVGFIQLLIYFTLATPILRFMGLSQASPMWDSAISYLRVRAFGTPAATLWLVSNGIFRGLGDTATPLVYSILFTIGNIILDPIFIFKFGWGASGAAMGTLLSQYAALIPLLFALHRKVGIDIWGRMGELGGTLGAYLKAGSYVLVRSLGKVLAYSVCAREAALLGTIAAAAYNLTFQLGFATTQICEAVAIAVQTLLAREIADTSSSSITIDNDRNNSASSRSDDIRHLIDLSLIAGGGVALSLSILTYIQRVSVISGLTSNPDVRMCALSIFTPVLVTQVLKGLAYPVNGIIMGGLDWKFTMIAMWAANFICVGILRGSDIVSLNRIWWALAAFMGTQVVTGVVRFESRTGVWSMLRRRTWRRKGRAPSGEDVILE